MATLYEKTGKCWLWPDHNIGKRESRQLREEHNRVVNQLADDAEGKTKANRVRVGWPPLSASDKTVEFLAGTSLILDLPNSSVNKIYRVYLVSNAVRGLRPGVSGRSSDSDPNLGYRKPITGSRRDPTASIWRFEQWNKKSLYPRRRSRPCLTITSSWDGHGIPSGLQPQPHAVPVRLHVRWRIVCVQRSLQRPQ